MRGVGCRFQYLQVTSKFSFTVPRSLISTASVWGSGQNRSSISQDTLPTTTWLARLFSSVTLTTKTSRPQRDEERQRPKAFFLQLAKAGRFCEKASKELKAGEKKDAFHIANKYHENTKTNNEPTSVICLTKAWVRPSVAQTSNVS